MGSTRREFLKVSGGVVGTFAFSAVASRAAAQLVAKSASGAQDVQFPQGVASADPRPDAVLIWTRAKPSAGGQVSLRVQVSSSRSFEHLVLEKTITAHPDSDYTVRVLVDELDADTTYYYRFVSDGGSSSRVGRTWTAPNPNDNRTASVAFVSCQSIQTGFMGTYRHLVNLEKKEGLERAVDLVVHLGDFIYENVPPQKENLPQYQDGRPRTFPPFPSGGTKGPRSTRAAVSTEDYRMLYKTYLSDPDLQAARASFPFVCIWDDHEFSDDSWQSFGLGRSMPRRRVDAYKAWFEFVPALLTESGSIADVLNQARDFVPVKVEDADMEPFDSSFLSTEKNNVAAMESITVYRSLAWGRNLDLMLTDLRSYRSPGADFDHSLASLRGEEPAPEFSGWGLPNYAREVLAAGKTYNGGKPPKTIEINGVQTPNPRFDAPPVTNLGERQKRWFKECLRESRAVWKVWGNPVPLMPFEINYSALGDGYSDSVLWPGDSWDAFPNERAELMSFIRDSKISNVVSLSGDRHLNAAGLVAPDHSVSSPEYVAADFACSSISMVTRVEIQSAEWRTASQEVRQLNAYESKDEEGRKLTMPNMNVAVRHGVRAAQVMAESNDENQAKKYAQKQSNKHIDFFDGYSHGYGIARFGAESATVDLFGFNVESRHVHWGDNGAPLAYRVQYCLKSWADGEQPTLIRSSYEGSPVFGDFSSD